MKENLEKSNENRSNLDKEKYKDTLNLVNIFSETISLIYKYSIFFGFLIIFYYCQDIGYFPKQLNFSDAIFSLILFAVFSTKCSIFLLLLAISSYTYLTIAFFITYFFAKTTSYFGYKNIYKRKFVQNLLQIEAPLVSNKLIIFQGAIYIPITILVLMDLGKNRISENDTIRYISSYISLVMIIMLLIYYFLEYNSKKNENRNSVEILEDSPPAISSLMKITLAVPMVAIITTLLPKEISLYYPMETSGLRKTGVSLYIKENVSKIIKNKTEPGKACSYSFKLNASDYDIFYNVDILMTGIGKKSLIKVYNIDSPPEAITLEVDTDDIIFQNLSDLERKEYNSRKYEYKKRVKEKLSPCVQ